jgi:hypothetical protein
MSSHKSAASTGVLPRDLLGKTLHFPSLRPYIGNWPTTTSPHLDTLIPFVDDVINRYDNPPQVRVEEHC